MCRPPYTNPQEYVQGVLLVQVLDGQKLRVQVIPGKTGAQVAGFTDAAMAYEQ